MVRFAFHQIVLANSIQYLPFISKLTEPFFRISKSHFVFAIGAKPAFAARPGLPTFYSKRFG